MIKENKKENNDILLNIRYNSEATLYEDALIEYSDAKNGYIYPVDALFINSEEFEVFKEELLKEFTDTKVYDFSSGKSFYQRWTNGNFSIMIRGNSKERYIYTQAKTLETAHFIHQLHKKCSTQESSVNVYVTTYTEKQSTTKVLDIKEFKETSESYYPYMKTDNMFQQFFTGNENILILTGKAGLGKTRLVSLMLKYAHNNLEYLPYDKTDIEMVENQFISVGKVKNINVLSSDSFWENIQKAQHDFIILDDLDFMLTKRDAEVRSQDDVIRNNFLSQFLTFTDGVESNNTKFIITTNQPFEDIDSALLRKGRLFNILQLRDLKLDEALVIWKENGLSESDFHNQYSDEFVNPADLGSEIHKRTNKRIKNKVENYLLEPEISKIQKAKRTKKIGL